MTKNTVESEDLRKLITLSVSILEDNHDYSVNKEIINKHFKSNLKFNNDEKKNRIMGIYNRLTIIDSYYSTNMKSYYGLWEIAERIKDMGTDKECSDYFKENIIDKDKINNLTLIFNSKYGFNKKGKGGNKANSLISKYAYFITDYGFPIYDSLAIESLYTLYNKISGKSLKKKKLGDVCTFLIT